MRVQGSDSDGAGTGAATQAPSENEEGSRMFTFCVVNQDGHKLDLNAAKSLLYTLGIGLGFSSQKYPLSPPNRDIQEAKF